MKHRFLLCTVALLTPLVARTGHSQGIAKGPITEQELTTLAGGHTTLVNFSGKDVPISALVEAIRTTAGTSTQIMGDAGFNEVLSKTTSVDWKDVPFWTAAAQVETLTGLRWYFNPSTGLELSTPFSFRNGNLNGQLAAQTPYLRLVGDYVSRDVTINSPLGAAPAPTPRNYSQLYLVAYADPKLPAAAVFIPDCQFQLQAGGPWVPFTNLRLANRKPDPAKFTSRLSLMLPDAITPGSVISGLKGHLDMELSRDPQIWKIPNVLQDVGTNQTFDGQKYVLERAKFKGDKLQLNVVFDMPKAEYKANGLLSRLVQLKLTDSAGNRLYALPVRPDVVNEADDMVTYDLELSCDTGKADLPIAPGPISLEWTVSDGGRSYEIPFELHDVKVP